MPVFIDQTSKLRSRKDFAVITVSLDEASTVKDVRRLIDKHHLTYPVLWYGPDVQPWEASDWDVFGVPSAFMIDPQGSLAYELYVDENFAAEAAYLMDRFQTFPPYSLRWSQRKLDDGSYELNVDVMSPMHLPLDVKVGIEKMLPAYYEQRDGKWVEVERDPAAKQFTGTKYVALEGYDGVTRQVTFGEFGETRLSFTVQPGEDATGLMYYASFAVPGSDGFPGAGGLRITGQGQLTIEQPVQQ